MALSRSPKEVDLGIGPILHLSHKLVYNLSCTFIFYTGPGSPIVREGIARFRNEFLIDYRGQPLRYLTSSMVWRAAIQLVVVESAGIILPALSFTVIQSI